MRCKPSEHLMLKHKKGLWSPDEDQKLAYYVMNHGHACWSSVAINAGLQRNGKSCRLRWVNYLRPGLKRGAFSLQEEETILTLHGLLGNKWSQISKHLPGRTDNEIKNYWHSQLKKKLSNSEHLEVSPVGDDKNSNNCKREPSSSYPSTSKFTNSLSADMDQSVTPFTKSSHLPRVLFADWISLDEFQQDLGKSSNQPLSYGSNYQQSTTAHELQCNEGSTASSETINCANSCSNEDMLPTEMTIDQIFNFVDADFYIDDLVYM